MSSGKRSLRQRNATGASVVDEALRKEIVSARLEALDDDFGAGKKQDEESDDDDFLVDADGEEIDNSKKKVCPSPRFLLACQSRLSFLDLY